MVMIMFIVLICHIFDCRQSKVLALISWKGWVYLGIKDQSKNINNLVQILQSRKLFEILLSEVAKMVSLAFLLRLFQ